MAFALTTHELNLAIDYADPIGGGGQGKVYRAFDVQLNATFAAKHIPKAYFKGDESRYFDEAKMLYDSRHNHVVEVKYGCYTDKYVIIVMPFYANKSLDKVIKRGNLTLKEILRYSLQILSGLNHIHSKKLVHFDLKLENVLVSDSNNALVSDFGIAKYTSDAGGAIVTAATRAFAPPEYRLGYMGSRWYDIYQAGLCIYRLCYGDDVLQQQLARYRTLEELDAAIQAGRFPDREYSLPHIPLKMERVIAKALSVNPDHRHRTVLEFINDIASIEDGLDWEYALIGNSNHVWTSQNEETGVIRELRADIRGATFDISATKNGDNVSKLTKKDLPTSAFLSNIRSSLKDSGWLPPPKPKKKRK